MDMPYETIVYEKKLPIAKITLNRPKVLNAVNEQMLFELGDVLDDIEKDDDIKVAIITGTGRAFAAGADIMMFKGKSYLDVRKKVIERGKRTLTKMEEMGKPFIAALNGLTLGGGCEIAMACDIRIASEKAKFGQPEINLGLTPGWGGTQRLTRLVGKGMAKKIDLTGDMIDADDARAIGLVDEVVPADKLEASVEALAEKLASKPPITVRCMLDAINKGSEMPLREALSFETDEFLISFVSEDAKEGISAFIEKRKATFKGK
jgi:enoyl-CoA hydratase